jgi:hypothetical protein
MTPLAGNGTNFVKLVALTATQTTTRSPLVHVPVCAPVAATAGNTRADAVPPLVTDIALAPQATAAIPVCAQPGNAVCTAALRAASRTPWRTEIESLNHSP